MTHEQNELLLQDLCARLPYKVMLNCDNTNDEELWAIDSIGLINHGYYINEVKPYLFPLSSMTEKQKKDLLLTTVGKEGLKLFSVTKDGIVSNDKEEQYLENFCFNNINFSNENIEAYIDWLNKNHFDYRGLIEKSLALDATNLGIYE